MWVWMQIKGSRDSFVCLIWFFTSTQQSFSYAGRVFLGWTSTKLGLMCLAQGPQRSDAGEARTCGPSVSSQTLYHWATARDSIPTRPRSFVEIDHEIISTVILLPSAESFKIRVVVSYKRKYVHEVLVNCLLKLAQEKVWLGELTIPPWPQLLTWDVKQQNKQTICKVIVLQANGRTEGHFWPTSQIIGVLEFCCCIHQLLNKFGWIICPVV